MTKVLSVDHATFGREVLESPLPVLADFYADWCGPCRLLAISLERLAAEFAGRVKFVKINVDAEPLLAGQFDVSSVPTLVVVVNGREVGRTAGLASEAALRQALTRLASAAAPDVGRSSASA